MTDTSLGFSLGSALTAVATAGQIANLLQNAIGDQGAEEQEVLQQVGAWRTAHFGAVSFLERENGVYAVNMDRDKPVRCQIASPDGDASLGPWKIEPRHEIFLGSHLFGRDIPGKTLVTFSNVEWGGERSSEEVAAARQTTVLSGRVNRIRLGGVQAVGAFTFRVTARQLFIAAGFAMTYFLLSRLQFTVNLGAGQQFSFNGLQGRETGGSSGVSSEKKEWVFDLPQHLGDFSIPLEAPLSLDFEVQYERADGEELETETVVTNEISSQEFAALEVHRSIIREGYLSGL